MTQQWMHIMEYCYGRPKNRMYVDGCECEDVVEYCIKVFLPFWFSIEGQMMTWDNNMNQSFHVAWSPEEMCGPGHTQ